MIDPEIPAVDDDTLTVEPPPTEVTDAPEVPS
jgi:hypothetical protein